jgi:hypothetical protein
MVVFDDVRVNFNFEWLFSKITTGIDVNPKGLKAFRVEPVPIWVVTNHTLKGDDTSHTRRQYEIAFSDFFNAYRTPKDHFGHNLFREWEWEQWNLYYNFLALCIQTYLRFPDMKKYTIPKADIERRRLRQQIGENFLEFADNYWDYEGAKAYSPGGLDAPSSMLNCGVAKTKVLNDYLEQFRTDSKFMTVKSIKEKCELYARYKGYDMNPNAGKDGRVKIGNIEYLVLANEDFNANNYHRVDA